MFMMLMVCFGVVERDFFVSYEQERVEGVSQLRHLFFVSDFSRANFFRAGRRILLGRELRTGRAAGGGLEGC